MKSNLATSKWKNITLVIHPTKYGGYDILAIGDISLLTEIARKEKYHHLIKKSKFGGIPILVMDTSDTLRGALSCIKEYRVAEDTMNNINKEKARRGLWRSACCSAPVKTEGGAPDFTGDNFPVTMYLVCAKCNKPCNLK